MHAALHRGWFLSCWALAGGRPAYWVTTIRYGLVDLSPLIDFRYPLEEISTALEHAIKPGTYRVVVEL